MRVTSQMIMDSSLHNIELNQDRIEQLQGQITSGSRITKPSDDPIGAARALNLEDSIAQSQQYQRNIDHAKSWLNTTDAVATFAPLFTAMQTLQTVLSAGNTTTIQTSISQLDTALDAVTVSRAQMGAKVNRLDFLETRQSSVEVNLTGLLSQTKDVD